MDIKDYISSGIIENYVLGNVSEQERQEVECLSHIYPEIQAELFNYQENIEALALSLSKKAPSHLKTSILSKISEIEQVDEGSGKIVSIQEAKGGKQGKFNFGYISAAASLVFAIVITTLFFSKVGDNERLNDLVVSQSQTIVGLQERGIASEEILKHVNDTATKKIILKGAGRFPNEVATVYFNENSSKTYSLLSGLETPPEDMQFQLWAIVDGKPLDLGVYNTEDKLTQNPSLIKAQAFAITIEKKGGASEPNLNNLVVIGNVI